MNEHIALIWKKLDHLARMREYLRYSLAQATTLMPIQDWQNLEPKEHETLAALRVRFSEYQEHMGKTMKAVAAEEEKPTEPFTAVLLYMEKLGCIESAQAWKLTRELRNAINHEYEEDTDILSEFFQNLIQAAPALFQWHDQLLGFCGKTYPSNYKLSNQLAANDPTANPLTAKNFLQGLSAEQRAALVMQSQTGFSQSVFLDPAEDCWDTI